MITLESANPPGYIACYCPPDQEIQAIVGGRIFPMPIGAFRRGDHIIVHWCRGDEGRDEIGEIVPVAKIHRY